MAWFDKNDAKIPEELRDAKPEDLVDAMKFYKENKDKVVKLESELGTTKQTLTNMESEFSSVKTKLAALEASPKPTPKPQAQNNDGEVKPTDFFEDPEKALFERVKPLADFSLQQGAMMAQMKLEQYIASKPGKFGDDAKLYSKYQKDIEELMKRETPVNQANPNSWYNAFIYVKGLHGDEIQEARTTGNKEFFGEPATKNKADEPDKSDVVTEQDKKMAERFGISDPQALVNARKGFTYDEGPQGN